MTYISPINSKIIKSTSVSKQDKINSNDGVYHDLIANASEIKPNKAKATLVRENPFQACVSSVKDFVKDGKNFSKAVKTGKMDDNSLGRINDFGMKVGGFIIATFLACMAKTKTSAIMQYIGGATFFASMALWPKLFINLPARLVHGFRIDQKYISAQGEKKDFFLDNQFLPWDAFSEDELRKNAKRAGIDYDGENGDEKIKRKMQKTALQNRTLWMATAGFATPLMTALIGDKVEPLVKKGVIKSGLNKSKAAVENFEGTMANAKPIVRNSKEIKKIIGSYQLGEISYDDMVTSLSKNLSFDLKDVFSNPNDLKAVEKIKFAVTPDMLNSARSMTSLIVNDDADTLIRNALTGTGESAVSGTLSALAEQFKSATKIAAREESLDKETIDAILAEFNGLDKKTFARLSEIVTRYAKNKGIKPSLITSKLEKINFKYNDAPFLKAVEDFNVSVLGKTRGRLTEYLKTILNPVIGDRDESLYTDMYREAMKKTIPVDEKSLSYKIKERVKGVLGFFKKDKAKTQALSGDEAYKQTLKKLFVKKDKSVVDLINTATSDANIGKIFEIADTDNKEVHRTLMGDLGESISSNIKKFTNIANVNNDSIRAKALIPANLERRIASKDFEQSLKDAGLISAEFPLEEWIKKARKLVYSGTVAADASKLGLKNESLFNKLRNVIYDSSKYSMEKEIFPGIDDVLEDLKKLGTSPKDNARVAGLDNLLKPIITEIKNNRAWKRIFVPMAVGLVAVTLIAQHFFGKIKNEFPDEKKGGKN